MAEAKKLSLFERIGGQKAISAAVTLFYGKIMADDSLTPFFADVDLDSQINKQIKFMTIALGGPSGFKAADLAKVHAPAISKGLNDQHFDAVAKYFEETLTELGVESNLVQEAIDIVASTRDAVLGR